MFCPCFCLYFVLESVLCLYFVLAETNLLLLLKKQRVPAVIVQDRLNKQTQQREDVLRIDFFGHLNVLWVYGSRID